MLSIRHKTMLELILAHPDGITGRLLSEKLRVSGKTVRNDIAAVNKTLKERGMRICASLKQGYYIEECDREKFSRLLEERSSFPGSREVQTPEERRFAILDRVLGHPGIRVDKIAEYLYVSEPTVYKDIARLERKLRNVCGFSGLEVRSHGVYLHGTEEEKRRLVFCLIWACVRRSGQLMDGNLHQLMNGIVNLHEIYAFCEQVEKYAADKGMDVPQQALFAGAWMIFYVNVRREEAYFLEAEQEFDRRDLLGDLLIHMDRTFFLEFEACDFAFLYQALKAVGFPAQEDPAEAEEAGSLSEQFFEQLRTGHGLVFPEPVREPFVRYVSRMLQRVRAGYQFCDWWPCDRERERLSRCFYEAGVLMARLVWERTGVYLTMGEVCHAGEHAAAWTRRDGGRVRILMVCDGDTGWFHMVRRWMEERLGDAAEIWDICPGYLLAEKWAESRADLIVGPQSLQLSSRIPCMAMPGALNPEEERKVRNFLEKAVMRRRSAAFLHEMMQKREVMFLEEGASFEKLAQACRRSLEEQQKAVWDGFWRETMEREIRYPWKAVQDCWLVQPYGGQAKDDGFAVAAEKGTGRMVFGCVLSRRTELRLGSEGVGLCLRQVFASPDFAEEAAGAKDGRAVKELLLRAFESLL